jgi:hypothetical protein
MKSYSFQLVEKISKSDTLTKYSRPLHKTSAVNSIVGNEQLGMCSAGCGRICQPFTVKLSGNVHAIVETEWSIKYVACNSMQLQFLIILIYSSSFLTSNGQYTLHTNN